MKRAPVRHLWILKTSLRWSVREPGEYQTDAECQIWDMNGAFGDVSTDTVVGEKSLFHSLTASQG
jgi:hypothetical protein